MAAPDEPLDESLAEHVLGYQLTIASLRTRQLYHEHVGTPFQLRPVEWTLLMLLLANPGAAPKRLARTLHLSAPNLTVLVDRLAARGLVERRRSATDGRALEVLLTAAGQQLAEQTHRISLSMEDELLARFTPGERVLLRELLARLAIAARATA